MGEAKNDSVRCPFVLANHLRDHKTQSPVARGIHFRLSEELLSA